VPVTWVAPEQAEGVQPLNVPVVLYQSVAEPVAEEIVTVCGGVPLDGEKVGVAAVGRFPLNKRTFWANQRRKVNMALIQVR
jgi:hypothetical protein